jgi:hypothetical protein
MSLRDSIINQMLDMRSGTILNAYYSLSGTSAYVDVVSLEEDGERPKTYTKVPILKIGGFSTALPPVGSTAVIGFIDNNESKPFLIGYMDSEISENIVTDDKTPRKPPTILTR